MRRGTGQNLKNPINISKRKQDFKKVSNDEFSSETSSEKEEDAN